ncbi:MAG: hypothetical protein ACPGOY_00675 [Rhodospirillaceae bacterium]
MSLAPLWLQAAPIPLHAIAALLLAGAFTLLPGRVMHVVVFDS